MGSRDVEGGGKSDLSGNAAARAVEAGLWRAGKPMLRRHTAYGEQGANGNISV